MTATNQVAVQWKRRNKVAKSLVTKPIEPVDPGAVVRWTKWDGYTYASIRGEDNPQGAYWYTTQDPRRSGGNKIIPLLWDELLDRIGQQNWNTLELLD
jgi:hypothetical protein